MAPKPKVTAEQIGKVRRLWADSGSMSVKQVADLLGISKSQAGRIMLTQQWVKDKAEAEKLFSERAENLQPIPPAVQTSAPAQTPEPSRNEPTAPEPPAPQPEPTRVTVVYPKGFEPPRLRLVADEVVAAAKPVAGPGGLFVPHPGIPDGPVRSPRSEQARVRMITDQRMQGRLERLRQRILAVDKAFVSAAKSMDPKAAMAAHALARTQQALQAMEVELLGAERDFWLEQISRGRDVAAPPEIESAPQPSDDDADNDAELEAEIRAKANGTWNPTSNLPPGWK